MTYTIPEILAMDAYGWGRQETGFSSAQQALREAVELLENMHPAEGHFRYNKADYEAFKTKWELK
jgi:hypothetical protein